MNQKTMVRLCYASTATFQQQRDANGIETNVARILMQSRRNNARDRVGGVLHFGDGYFFQCLEGDREAVNRIYQRIGDDPRHKDVQLLSLDEIDRRMFSDWSMKYVAIERAVETLLRKAGLKQFNPYQFDRDLIASLLAACVSEKDPTHLDIPDPSSRPDSARPGFFRRLLGAR